MYLVVQLIETVYNCFTNLVQQMCSECQQKLGCNQAHHMILHICGLTV